MRYRLALEILVCCSLAMPMGAQESPIPSHPRDLQWSTQPIELPTGANRWVRLASGPRVYLAEDHTLPLVEISLALRVGSFLEPPEKTGLAYLTASQIRRGGTAEIEADMFDDRLELLGARVDTMSGTTRSGVGLSVPTRALDEGLDLWFAMLAQPGFQVDRLVVSRGSLLESLTRRNEDALDILQREWEWLMYGEDHFSTRPMTPDTLAAIERDDLKGFHRTYWRPDQMILAVSGDFDRQQLLADLENRFAAWQAAGSPTTPMEWPPPAPGLGAPPGLYHYEMEVPQAKVILGHRLPALLDWSDSDRFALAVVAEILGGQGAISRIAGRLRTAEGLVYRATARIYPGDLWPGEVQIFFETQGSSVEKSLALALEEIERLRTERVHPTELAVVKQSLTARLRLQFDTAEEISGYFAEDELLGRPHSFWQEYLQGISDVTQQQVLETAGEYLKFNSMLVLVVGRWTAIAPSDRPGLSPLEELVGHPKTSMRTRDPLTLESPRLD